MQQEDPAGRIHKVKFFQNPETLLQCLPQDAPVFLDIDLDYFAIESRPTGGVVGSENLLPDPEIKSFLSPNGTFFGQILHRIVGFTIALEPKYCGGLANSFHVLDILNRELFEGTLCTSSCKWKEANKQ